MASSLGMNDGLGCVRIKPLGAGGGGGEYNAESCALSPDNLPPVTFDIEENSIDVMTSGGRRRRYDYPTSIIPPSYSQESTYNHYMPSRVSAFMAGYDVNIMAYGQTGSGKTHTMFGPPGVMEIAAGGEYGLDVYENYGLFPRGLLDIVSKVKALSEKDEGERKYVLTASCVEVGLFGKVDMFVASEGEVNWTEVETNHTSNSVHIDHRTEPKELYGQVEVDLHDSDANIYRTFAALATRNTMATTMNDSSSRTCCFARLTLYCYDPSTDSVRRSWFQFVDLAGSERLGDAHGGNTNWRANLSDHNFMAGFGNNWSLMQLSRCVRELVQYRKHGSRGKFSFSSYMVDLVFMLSESMTGAAHTAIFVCLSQAPANNMQTSNALEFGEGERPASVANANELKSLVSGAPTSSACIPVLNTFATNSGAVSNAINSTSHAFSLPSSQCSAS